MVYFKSPLMLYFLRHALMYFLIVLFVLCLITFLTELIEYTKQTSNIQREGFLLSTNMALLHLPFMIQRILPYAVLFGTMLSLLRLSKNSELVIARAAGLNIWQCCLPYIFLAILIGIINIGVLSPITAVTQTKLMQIETNYFNKNDSRLQVSGGGFWLHQQYGEKSSIIHADAINPEKMELQKVIIFRYDKNNFYERIDGKTASLKDGYWEVSNGIRTDHQQKTNKIIIYKLNTNLTSTKIKESFAPPDTMSFWSMLRFIEIIENAGFSSRKHLIHWHSLLSSPFLFIGMVLIGATFSVRQIGRKGIGIRIFVGIILAFIIFFLNDIASVLGQGSSAPAEIAAWVPALMPILISASVLLYLEDG